VKSRHEANIKAPVAFTIAGLDLNIDEISRNLGVDPTHSHRIGEIGMLGKSYPHNMWQLDSPLTAAEPDEHLKWLDHKLRPNYDFIRSLKDHAQVYVYCGFNCESDQCGFSLSPQALTLLTELGIPLEVHVLC
jgi:hypothetical protein